MSEATCGSTSPGYRCAHPGYARSIVSGPSFRRGSWLNNLKIANKIIIIVMLLIAMAASSIGYNCLRMKQAGAAYSDIITRVDTSIV